MQNRDQSQKVESFTGRGSTDIQYNQKEKNRKKNGEEKKGSAWCSSLKTLFFLSENSMACQAGLVCGVQ